MFKVKNKNTRTTSLTNFTPFKSVSVVDFEVVNVSWVLGDSFCSKCVVKFIMKDVNVAP